MITLHSLALYKEGSKQAIEIKINRHNSEQVVTFTGETTSEVLNKAVRTINECLVGENR